MVCIDGLALDLRDIEGLLQVRAPMSKNWRLFRKKVTLAMTTTD